MIRSKIRGYPLTVASGDAMLYLQNVTGTGPTSQTVKTVCLYAGSLLTASVSGSTIVLRRG